MCPRRNTGIVGSSSAQRQTVFTFTCSIAASWAGVTYSGVGDFGVALISRITSPYRWQPRSGLVSPADNRTDLSPAVSSFPSSRRVSNLVLVAEALPTQRDRG